jgi:hypothetical protein
MPTAARFAPPYQRASGERETAPVVPLSPREPGALSRARSPPEHHTYYNDCLDNGASGPRRPVEGGERRLDLVEFVTGARAIGVDPVVLLRALSKPRA